MHACPSGGVPQSSQELVPEREEAAARDRDREHDPLLGLTVRDLVDELPDAGEYGVQGRHPAVNAAERLPLAYQHVVCFSRLADDLIRHGQGASEGAPLLHEALLHVVAALLAAAARLRQEPCVLILVLDALGHSLEVAEHLLLRLAKARCLRCLCARGGDLRKRLAGLLQLREAPLHLLPEADDQLDLALERREAVARGGARARGAAKALVQAAELLHLGVEVRLEVLGPGFRGLP
mmetsp:Transcript_90806/g.241314  ORF Transcript_90806/g.241314 Transcript_90806/m.241314 type:complete len:237 (+) Transcript_90806:2-712(+)